MKHNKKRNTAFIYEALVKELTKATVEKNQNRSTAIMDILKEHFSRGTLLHAEMQLYSALLETRNVQRNVAERMLQEIKSARAGLSEENIFDAQSQVIAAINKNLGQHVWANFVPNFKTLASISSIFNKKAPVKQKVLFEEAIVDRMSQKVITESDNLKSIDNLTYRSFINKFNNKYGDLLQEQKDLLNRYITSFADDGFELRLYLNEELTRLMALLKEAGETELEPLISQKVENVVEYLEGFRKREFTETDLNKVLKTQELVQELAAHD
tara:strand:+ start:408 stop:1217 length:810 start_codon:yes stop_codon:yes gene_type:complete